MLFRLSAVLSGARHVVGFDSLEKPSVSWLEVLSFPELRHFGSSGRGLSSLHADNRPAHVKVGGTFEQKALLQNPE